MFQISGFFRKIPMKVKISNTTTTMTMIHNTRTFIMLMVRPLDSKVMRFSMKTLPNSFWIKVILFSGA